MSYQSTTKMARTNRVWSHNTNYTGAAGIHSEDGPVAHARNNLMDRRSSDVLTAEEEILKKKIKSLGISRKSLENSMLSYSQKMKDIAEKRERVIKSSPSFQEHPNQPSPGGHGSKSAHKINTNTKMQLKDNGSGQRVVRRETSLSSLSPKNKKEHPTNSPTEEPRLVEKTDPLVISPDQRGRISVDSGVGMDSDSYASDAESVSKPRLASSLSGRSVNSVQSEPIPRIERRKNRIRDQRKRFQRVEKIELATVVDTERPGSGENYREKDDTTSEEVDELVTISPFPCFFSDTDAQSNTLGSISEYDSLTDDFYRTRILDPMTTSSPRNPRKYRVTPQPKRKTPHVLTKPKVIYSPSLASLRFRRLNRNSKKNSKSHRHTFKYSDAVETALRSLNNSPEGRRDSRVSNASPPLSPDLPGLDLNELLHELYQRPHDLDILLPDEPDEPVEIKPHRLFRERSISDPIARPPAFNPPLEQVREDDDSELRSVLRKNNVQYPAEKKSVQFFLPDIFTSSNACTSRPATLR